MVKELSLIESEILSYLYCLEKGDTYILLTKSEIKQIITKAEKLLDSEISEIIKNLERLGYIKIKYSNDENFLIILCEKTKNYNNNIKLKNPYIFRKNARFYIFLFSIFGSFLGASIALLLYNFFIKIC